MSTLAPMPAWGEYADASAIEHFAWWVETHCVQTIDQFRGQPLVLEGWQLELMAEALAVDADGFPYWQMVVLVVPRKNGKTTLMGAYAAYHLLTSDGQPQVLLAASSDKQAGRLFDAVQTFMLTSPVLEPMVHVRDYVGEINRVDGDGAIYRLALDPNTVHGWNPSRTFVDELHAFTTPSARRAWGALTTGSGARRDRQTVAITTAGEASDRATGILGQLIDRNQEVGDVEVRGALTISRNHEARVLVYNYEAPTSDATDVAALKAANPASWITEGYLRQQASAPGIDPATVLQLHGCVWADSHGQWIPAEWWRACEDRDMPAPDPAAPCVAGVDIGLTSDSSAVALAWPLDDGRIRLSAWVLSPDRRTPAHAYAASGRINLSDVEDYLVADPRAADAAQGIADRFDVHYAVYDPQFFERSAEIVSDRGLDTVHLNQQSAEMRKAYQAFYQAVKEGRIVHDGDPVLTAHVLGAAATLTERGWDVRKLRHTSRIDGLVASVMAVHFAPRVGGGGVLVEGWD